MGRQLTSKLQLNMKVILVASLFIGLSLAAPSYTDPRGAVCEACKTLIGAAENKIDGGHTEDELVAALKEFCTKVDEKLPGVGIKDTCDGYMDLYIKPKLDTLVADLSPESVCTVLTLCP